MKYFVSSTQCRSGVSRNRAYLVNRVFGFVLVLLALLASGEWRPVQAAKSPAPTGVLAVSSSGQVALQWDFIPGAKKYRVRRATKAGGPFTNLATTTAQTYVDTDVHNGTTYYYVIQVTTKAGTSGNSAVAIVTPHIPVPQNVNALFGSRTVVLLWDPVVGALGYRVKRSTSPVGPFVSIATPGTNTYVDDQRTNGLTYYYVVTAYDGDEESPNSDIVAVTPFLVPPPKVEAIPGNKEITISWFNYIGVERFMVKRSLVSGGPYETIATVDGGTYVDRNLKNGVTYYYVVSALDENKESANSFEVSAVPHIVGPGHFTAVVGTRQVDLRWDQVPGATSYNVKRSSVKGGPYQTIASISGTSYSDISVQNGTTYFYVVTAIVDKVESSNSAELQVMPQLLPPVPHVVPEFQQVTLTWESIPGADSFNVKRSTTPGGPYILIANITGTAYVDKTVTDDKTYYYVVSTVDGGMESANSVETAVVPHIASPISVVAIPGDRKVTLAWTAVVGASGYNVLRSQVKGGPYTLIKTTTETNYVDNGVINDVTYYYVISAFNAKEQSANSLEASAQPAAPQTQARLAAAGKAVPFKLMAAPDEDLVTLDWTTRLGAAGYQVYRADAGTGRYALITTTATPGYIDRDVKPGVTYYYVVVAVSSNGMERSQDAAATPGSD